MPTIETEFIEPTRDLDIETFWDENKKCLEFTPNKPRCALSFSPDDHWLFEFLSVASTTRYYRDKEYRDSIHKEANRLTREYVGTTFFEEDSWVQSPKRIENLFGCEFTYTEGATPWLTPVTEDPDEFSRVLDRAEEIDIAKWAFPELYLEEWERRKREGRPLPKLGDGSRGPATIMTSVLAPETFMYWVYDRPDLIARFSDLLGRKMVELNAAFRKFGDNEKSRGWWITDDNSALFSPKLYEKYCVPVLERVLDAMAPDGSERYQHSDSAMGHLLDYQRQLGINRVNYGPEIDVGFIRKKMPNAMILGHLPPFLLRNGTPEEIRQRVIEDFRKAGETGGLEATTAGSLAAGTGLGRMRWQMQLVQELCRYDCR